MSKDKISCVFCIYNVLGKIEEIYKIVSHVTDMRLSYIKNRNCLYIHIHAYKIIIDNTIFLKRTFLVQLHFD